MWQKYFNVKTIEEAISLLANQESPSRIVAGATDLMLEIERGQKPHDMTLIDISRISGLDQIHLDDNGNIHLGPMVTHNHCVASKLLRECALPLVQASWEVGSPQIRNRGTIAGNLITASPANDTITPLVALGAKVVLKSSNGERTIPLKDFYTGVRKTQMRPNEMLVDIFFQSMLPTQKGIYVKYALRQAQAISVINLAIIMDFQGNFIKSATIALGAVAPTIIHADVAEDFLPGKQLDTEIIDLVGKMIAVAAQPIDDIRGSAKFRRKMVEVIATRALRSLLEDTHANNLPQDPVLLRSKDLSDSIQCTENFESDTPISTTINQKTYTFRTGQTKSLLRLLREEGLLTGVKEGCAEGECGACTIFLDGQAVMSCMVPAPRADGAIIVTIEGISEEGELHPIQSAFIDKGAVQCGYCTPGLIMSTVMLLDEKPNPTRNQIQQAIMGNLCRCTGYYKILEAVEQTVKERINGQI
jgi:xanthine dehydrogenase iron-sulfur cluster and FAD-binding subunit A